MNVIAITDPQAPQLDVYARLTQAQLRSRRRPEDGLFIAESAVVIGHALDAGYQPVSLLMERRQLEGKDRPLAQRVGDVPIYVGEREVLSGITGYALTRGVLCAMRRPALPTVEQVCAGAKRLAVLEGIVDGTNVGAIFRCAAALGMDGVLVSPTCIDPLCRRSVRVSMGTVFQVPWTYIGAAMALDDGAVSIDDPRLERDRLALVLGTEGDGLDPETIARCDCTVCIPMAHGVDSLNVAAASAVAFWQLRAR